MNLKPVLGKVIIKVVKQSNKIGNTNLIMPDAAKEKQLGMGLCMSGEYEGENVYYKKYMGEEIVDGEVSYFVIDEEDLLAVIN